MVNKMTNDVGNLIALNDEYLYLSSATHDAMFAPLRPDSAVLKKITHNLSAHKPDPTSCISAICGDFVGGKYQLATEFRETTKCTTTLKNPSNWTKTELCYKQLCNGKCTDEFMQKNIAKYILPELYNSKQR